MKTRHTQVLSTAALTGMLASPASDSDNADKLSREAENRVAGFYQRSNPGELESQRWAGRPHSECPEHSARGSGERWRKLELHHPLDYSRRLPDRSFAAGIRPPGSIRLRRARGRATDILPFSEEGQSDPGRRPQLLLPAATGTGILGQGKFGLGLTIVALVSWVNGVSGLS
jgi:hypothetical protein